MPQISCLDHTPHPGHPCLHVLRANTNEHPHNDSMKSSHEEMNDTLLAGTAFVVLAHLSFHHPSSHHNTILLAIQDVPMIHPIGRFPTRCPFCLTTSDDGLPQSI